MSTTIARRLARVEGSRFAAACRQFRPWFLQHLADPDHQRRRRAALVAAGTPPEATREELLAWFRAQPQTPAARAWHETVCGTVGLLMERPDDHAAIRAALARLAPHVGRCAGDPSLLLLAALRAMFDY